MRALEGLRVRRGGGGRGSGAEIKERGGVSRIGRERGRKKMEVGKRWIGVRQGLEEDNKGVEGRSDKCKLGKDKKLEAGKG